MAGCPPKRRRNGVKARVLPPRGDHGFGWDPVFVPQGETTTYAELGDARKDEIGHRGRAWRALLHALSSPE